MHAALLPKDETARLAALRALAVLDTPAEPVFDDLTRMAARVCGVPIALISLVDEHRQWFKSRVGLAAQETPREIAFCAHAILVPHEVLVVPDAVADPRFAQNPLTLADPYIRFYAGAPLCTPAGQALGTLCVLDHSPRRLTAEQLDSLAILARQVVSQLELRRAHFVQQDLMQELERSNKDLLQFASYAAHDLHEPVRSLIGFSSVLQSELKGDCSAKTCEVLDRIQASAQRMRQLIEDLLALARAGSLGLRCEWLGLDECANGAKEALAHEIESSNALVRVAPLPRVLGDRTLLTQLFQNLLSNALKFRGTARPRIDIRAFTVDGEAVISVRDQGIGMDPAFAAQAFQPFRRLHTRQKYPGSGLGLTIAQRIVERHHGRIWIDRKVRRGCRVCFSIPDAAFEHSSP